MIYIVKVVAFLPAKGSSERIKNGLELHISSMPFRKWQSLIKKYFSILQSQIVSSRSDKSKVSEVYLLKVNNLMRYVAKDKHHSLR